MFPLRWEERELRVAQHRLALVWVAMTLGEAESDLHSNTFDAVELDEGDVFLSQRLISRSDDAIFHVCAFLVAWADWKRPGTNTCTVRHDMCNEVLLHVRHISLHLEELSVEHGKLW